ncbi:MAG: HAMP domain-containing histidine kinase [Myxococcales bacterium]|nr:HAMP domain-containing histidine kinase [Myxococcales bacterium]
MKLRTRLLLFGALIPVGLLVLGTVLAGVVFERAMLEEHDRALLGQAAVEAVSLFDRANVPHLHLGESPIDTHASEHPAHGALYGPAGERIASYPEGADAPPRLQPEVLTPEPAFHTETAGGSRRRVLQLRVDDPQGRGFALWLAASLDRHDREMSTYWRSSSLVLVGIAGLLLVVQVAHARRLGLRVGGLGEHMRQLRAGRLDARPPADPVGDEISELRDAIEETTIKLEAAQRAQDRLVADAAHELRTPLASMRANIDVTLRRERSPEQLRASLDEIRTEVDRLAELATRLLDLAALRASPLHVGEGDLVPTVLEAVDAARAAGEPRGVVVQLELPERARAAHAPEALRQALDNLLSNALKLSPPDGQVQVSLREDEGGFRITVTDQGPGVPPTERDAIFEPFHRVTSHVDGKGLGLAIVRDVAQRHGGRVWVEDGPGAGARFCLWLPASPGRGSQPS